MQDRDGPVKLSNHVRSCAVCFLLCRLRNSERQRLIFPALNRCDRRARLGAIKDSFVRRLNLERPATDKSRREMTRLDMKGATAVKMRLERHLVTLKEKGKPDYRHLFVGDTYHTDMAFALLMRKSKIRQYVR